MQKKSVIVGFVLALALGSLYGCGGGSSSDNTPSTDPVKTDGKQVISSTSTTGTATAAADVFQLVAGEYTATISKGFKYNSDIIEVPTGSTKPTAVFGGVNGVVDGKVALTWNSNGKLVTLNLTDLDAISEAALESSSDDASANIYKFY
jgi:hypothetical protein